MRLHRTVGATIGVLLLALAVPSAAHATTGDFNYKTSKGEQASISDQTSRVCINLPYTTEADPGNSPENLAITNATVFLEADCDGDTYSVLKPGEKLGEDVKVRSVMFD
ncbi:hypothetical protein ACIBTP_06890 [Streptomyces avidinii]|uniref:hypothetical protein n=1 Tax=Streptomyces avidinii TaxID=1895 RepID=UPI0037A646AE